MERVGRNATWVWILTKWNPYIAIYRKKSFKLRGHP